jgi:enolase
MRIREIQGRVVKDSCQQEAVEAVVVLENGAKIVSSVGYGRSRGRQEKTQDKPQQAVRIIKDKIKPALLGRSILDQVKIDKILDGFCQDKDAGVNTILAVSQVIVKAGAKDSQKPIWQYLIEIMGLEKPDRFPCSLMVIIEGARHNLQNEKPQIQEYLVGVDLETASKIYSELKDFLKKEKVDYGVGSEGALAPDFSDDLKILEQFKRLKMDFDFKLGLDMAAESNPQAGNLSNKIVSQYPIDIIEDPFAPSDISKWQELCEDHCDRKIIVGDDLTVTDSRAIRQAAQRKLINGVIIKPNQAGTITQTFEAIRAARENSLKIIVSHRAQETKDDILADIAVAAGADYLKAGYPTQIERKMKYDRLKNIKAQMSNVKSNPNSR